MPGLLDQLHADHANFERLLAALEGQLDRLHEAEPADLELMHDIMRYMTNYPDLVHHPREGQVFARVIERDPGAREALAEVGAEHQALAEKGERFRETLATCVDGAMVRRDALEAEGRGYVATLRGHMALEDAEAFPLAERTLEPADWEAIDARLDERADPVFGPVVEEQYRALLEYIGRHAPDP